MLKEIDSGLNIIFKTKFGSHLYGTNTPTSDLDYKGIFIQPIDEVILGIKHETQFNNVVDKLENGRNTADAIDCEYIELRKFISDCLNGQTYALDMIFSNKDLWEIGTEIWSDLLANREKLLSKDVAPYIGYCRNQANKYGLKGSRLGELLKVINILTKLPSNDRLEEHLDVLELSEFVKIEHTIYNNTGRELEQNFLVVLGRKFELKTRIKDILQPLATLNEKYGSRAVEAMKNEGIDWKAISHAFRCMYQLEELALTGKIEFPLKKADELLQIKKGQIPWEECNGRLYSLMENTIKLVEESPLLPEKPDYEFWNKWLINQYKKQLV